MENKEIMDRLLQEDKPISNIKDDVSLARENWGSSISKIRRVTAKYKLYIIILVILICCFLFFWLPDIKDKLKSSKSNYDTISQQITNLERDIKDAEDDINYLCDDTDWVIKNEEALKACLNKKSGCASLPQKWKNLEWDGEGDNLDENVKIPLSYLQLQSLYNEKMPVDEKRVLKNLNEYLIKQNISWWDRAVVWEILTINIWDPEPIWWEDSHFFKVSVDVEIEFDTVKDLVEFLYNVEKKMVNDAKDRILYKIQSVSYDVVSNDEPQVTDISMVAYYYYDEKFGSTVSIFATVEWDDIKLSLWEWKSLPNKMSLRQQIKKSEVIEAKDLFELPDRLNVEFKNWNWIDTSKNMEKKKQKVLVDIEAKPECDISYNNMDSGKEVEKWTDTNNEDSDSIFDKIFSDF